VEFIVELARRFTGAGERADAGWRSLLTAQASTLQRGLLDWSVADVTRRLSASEYRDFTAALYGQPRMLQDLPRAAAVLPAASAMRLMSGYPRGFVTSVLTSARCNVGRQRDVGAGGSGGDMTYRTDRRPARVALIAPPESPECARAVRALLLTYVPAAHRRLRPDERDTLMFPFEPGFVECQDAVVTAAPEHLSPGGDITPPKQIRRVNPAYPPTAQADRVSGTVIIEATLSTTGCVADAEVTTSVDARLDWAALRAVSGWAYTPTLLGGVAVPVIMTVTVGFSLK
jgi:TonB family protein